MEDWAEWQLNYLHGLLVIWPPDAVRQMVNRLRQQYDPESQATIEAHISLTQPFLARPGDEEWALLAEIVAGFEPFEISYGPADTFFPNPVIYLAIRPREHLLALRQALHGTGLFNLTLPYTDDFVPHMTVAEGRSSKVVDEKMLAEVRAQAPSGTFPLNEIAVVAPVRGFHFGISKRLRLGSSQRTSHSHA
jgi:2'-5' RNA ligase